MRHPNTLTHRSDLAGGTGRERKRNKNSQSTNRLEMAGSKNIYKTQVKHMRAIKGTKTGNMK